MNINTMLHEAFLAQAAYVDKLDAGMTGDVLVTRLISNKYITQAQAEYFAERYEVVKQSENLETGFSATLFKEIKTGEYHLAVRGSAEPGLNEPDWTDANPANGLYGISYNQVTDLLNFYLQLSHTSGNVAQFSFKEDYFFQDDAPPSQPYILIDTLEMEPGVTRTTYLTFSEIDAAPAFGSITNTQQLNLTGHSLGGHLASAFTLLVYYDTYHKKDWRLLNLPANE